MTTSLEQFRDAAAARALARYGEKAARVHPTWTTVDGQTVAGTPERTNVRGVVTARSGDVKEQGWGQTAEGEFQAVVDIRDGWTEGDLYEASEGVWSGTTFRVTFVDRQGSLLALDRVTEGNE